MNHEQVYQVNQNVNVDALVERLLVSSYKMQSMINVAFEDDVLIKMDETNTSLLPEEGAVSGKVVFAAKPSGEDTLYCLWAISAIAGQMRLVSEALRDRLREACVEL